MDGIEGRLSRIEQVPEGTADTSPINDKYATKDLILRTEELQLRLECVENHHEVLVSSFRVDFDKKIWQINEHINEINENSENQGNQ